MTDPLTPFLEATVRTATPLALAALGESIVERAGLINIGLEGAIVAGAFGAFVGAQVAGGGVGTGMLSGALAGIATGVIFATFAVWLRADQIITGTAVTLLALGLTGTLYRIMYGETTSLSSIPMMSPIALPGLAGIPFIGRALFAQPAITYLLYLVLPAAWWWSTRTHAGLALRAVGERPDAAAAAGIDTDAIRWSAVLIGGMLGGVGGATLVLAQAGTFVEGMSAGRGFIAIAIVALGRWQPLGVALAALLFGAASALQYLFQSMGWTLPYQLFLALPYALTLVALAGAAGRSRAPAALGRTMPVAQ